MSYATTVDVELELERSLSAARAERVTVLLARAALLINRVPGVTARLALGELDAEILKMVSVDMVLRALRPGDVKSETIGPKSVTYKDTGEPGLYLLERELALLEPPVSTTVAPAARSVQMSRPRWWER